ncbi:hypothetical protein, partial [Spirochaeta dissipatitropha]
EQVSGFQRNHCPVSSGITVRFPAESLSAFLRNGCPFWTGVHKYKCRNQILQIDVFNKKHSITKKKNQDLPLLQMMTG